MVASRDRRFLNLARFLLSRRGIFVTRTCRLGSAADAASQTGADVLVIEANGTASARTTEELTETRPTLGVVVVDERDARVGDGSGPVEKWSLHKVAAAIEREHARVRSSLVPSERVDEGTAVHR